MPKNKQEEPKRKPLISPIELMNINLTS